MSDESGGTGTARNLLLTVAAALLLASGASQAQSTVATATVSHPATVPVRVPPGTGNRLLQLWVRTYRPPGRGAVEAAVSLVRGDKEVEVGRFAVFPSEPFVARTAAQERGYVFDAASALASLDRVGGELVSRLGLAPVEWLKQPTSAERRVSRAELSPPP